MGPPALLAHTSLSFRCKCWAVRMAPSGPQMWLQPPQNQLHKQPRPHHLITPSPGMNLPSSCSINKASCSSGSGLSLSTLRDTTTHLQTHTCGVACSEHTRICDSTQRAGPPTHPRWTEQDRQTGGCREACRGSGGRQHQGLRAGRGKSPRKRRWSGWVRAHTHKHTPQTQWLGSGAKSNLSPQVTQGNSLTGRGTDPSRNSLRAEKVHLLTGTPRVPDGGQSLRRAPRESSCSPR